MTTGLKRGRLLTLQPVFLLRPVCTAMRDGYTCSNMIFPVHKKIAVIVLIATFFVLFYNLDLGKYLTIDQLQATRESVESLYTSYRVATVAVFIALYTVLSALALPGPLLLTLVAGAVFGIATGAVYTSLAAATGASLTFLAARYIFRDLFRKKIGTRLDKVNAELEKKGLRHLIFMRLVLIFPFTMINLAAAMTSMPLRTFFLGTLVGVFPPNLILANAGAGVATITRVGDIFSVRVVGSLFLLGLLALAPIAFRKVRRWYSSVG